MAEAIPLLAAHYGYAGDGTLNDKINFIKQKRIDELRNLYHALKRQQVALSAEETKNATLASVEEAFAEDDIV